MTKLTTTHTAELERTIASDPVLSEEQHSAEVYLARTLATELDRQAAAKEPLQTRTIASYAGVLGALRRVVRDEKERRRRDSVKQFGSASRLALIKKQAATVRERQAD